LKEIGYTRAVDYWALGIVLYEMLVGRLPFTPKSHDVTPSDQQEFYYRILNDRVYFPCDLSQESILILSQLLDKDPNTRLGSGCVGFQEIKSHRFFTYIDWVKLFNKEVEPPFRPMVTSEIDTCYFETDFTGENVQLTPPDSNARLDLTNEINYFDSFSFYGSKTSLNSHVSMKSMDKVVKNNDKYEISSLVNESISQNNKSNSQSSDYLPSPHSLVRGTKSSRYSSQCEEEEISSVYLASNAFPNIIQFTDNTGQFFYSKTFFNDSSQTESSKSSSLELEKEKNKSFQIINPNTKQEFQNINLNYKYLQDGFADSKESF
jgi:hypothetical protein